MVTIYYKYEGEWTLFTECNKKRAKSLVNKLLKRGYQVRMEQ